jgi:hypothetical protein
MIERLPRSPLVAKPTRVVKSYMVQPHLNEAMRTYAVKHRYTLASCVDSAFAEFLAKHGAER